MNWRLRFELFLLTSLVAIIFVAPAQAVITHRYSFTGNANDSVGTANWTVNGGAAFAGGQVVLDGVDDYLKLSATPLPTSGSVTMEIWGTYDPTTAVGSRIVDFSTPTGNSYMYLSPRATPGTPTGHSTDATAASSNTRWRWDDDNTLPDLGPMVSSPSNTGQEVLFTLVYDSTTVTTLGSGEFRLYRDGALVGSDSAEGLPILGSPLSGTTENRLGHGTSSPYATATAPALPVKDLPAFLKGSFNEVRIYNNVLTPLQVLTNLITGPDATSVSFNGKTWGAATSDWNTGGNWGGTVPVVGDRATISNGGTATVSSVVAQTGAATISNGTLSVGSGGSLNVKYPIELNTGATNTATINVTNGGELSIGGIISEVSTGAKSINIDGGTIRPSFKSALVNAGATTNIGAGGATFDAQGTDNITWGSDLAGSGNVTKTGTGTLILRPSNIGAGLAAQNPNFSGEVFVNQGTLDVQREHGVFGTAGSTKGGIVHLNNSTLVINTANPTAPGFRKEFPADVVVTGSNVISNVVDRGATEIRMQGSISGDGTLEFVKPNLADALGVDFLDRADPDILTPPPTQPPLFVNYNNFTGRLYFNGNWAVRLFATLIDPDAIANNGDEIKYESPDFPQAIIQLGAGAYLGKRGTSPDQVIRIGGVEGVAPVLGEGGVVLTAGSTLQASIAGDGDIAADLTYQLGGASQDAVFNGSVIDNNATDNLTIQKVGSNIQTFGGANTYSGTTTVNGGTLRVNGTHQMHATFLLPVGDYTVNTGGTLGGTGTIGSAADPVNILNNGGTIAPGASVGTLTSFGNTTFGANSHLAIEVVGATADKLAVTGNIDLSALANSLDVTGTGSGSWVIATYTGTLTGVFESITSGLAIDYGTRNNGQITITGTLSPAGLPGDYNGDNKVDAADYTVWRDHLGEANESALHNNGDGGQVTASDYTHWKQHFGTPGSGANGWSGNNVPEPASIALLGLAIALLGMHRRK